MRLVKVLLAVTATVIAIMAGAVVFTVMAAGVVLAVLLGLVRRRSGRRNPTGPSRPPRPGSDVIDVTATEVPPRESER